MAPQEYSVTRRDVFGFVRPMIDAHTLGLSSVSELLKTCGLTTVIADRAICEAVVTPKRRESINLLKNWILRQRITRLGFSYRLDPRDGATAFIRFFHHLHRNGLLADTGGPLKSVYFAGLPQACELVVREFGSRVKVFRGDESPEETLTELGLNSNLVSTTVAEELSYDRALRAFASELIAKGEYLAEAPLDRSASHGYGTERDSLVTRIRHSAERHLPPLIRAHVGPYLPDRTEAIRLFLEWCRRLGTSGLLDILSVGTSQLSQANFGEDWRGLPNGGGVPLNSAAEFSEVWQAARPMLVRTYAGTRNTAQLAWMYEETLHAAWHTFSFWWFCQLDGRGPLSLRENLDMHIETLRFVANSGKPFEPNVSHHFSFRGADDVTYVVSAVLAAQMAKSMGVRYLVLPNMLNTPKSIWGTQDLAKSRVMLSLVRQLEDNNFRVFLQPRAGLDLFSPDPEKAKIQLAAASALMDDIEPHNWNSPPIIHVVSYSEAFQLADPAIIDESIRITRAAIREYRSRKADGEVPVTLSGSAIQTRTKQLMSEARTVLRAIEEWIQTPRHSDRLYEIFAAGFLPVPFLWECRDKFQRAVQWRTKLIRGGVMVVDEKGRPISAEERIHTAVNSIPDLCRKTRRNILCCRNQDHAGR